MDMDHETTIVGGNLRTERLPNGKRTLLRALTVRLGGEGGEDITVPAGTETDFSSIPWFGRILVRWSRVDIAGVVHDYLYAEQSKSRREADRIWRDVAIAGEHSANWVQVTIGYLALRISGWISWARKREISWTAYWFHLHDSAGPKVV